MRRSAEAKSCRALVMAVAEPTRADSAATRALRAAREVVRTGLGRRCVFDRALAARATSRPSAPVPIS